MKNSLLGLYSTLQDVCREIGISNINSMITCTEEPFITLKMEFTEANLIMSIDFDKEELEGMSTEHLVNLIVLYYDSRYSGNISTELH